jgi:hypothetical protein
MSDRSDLRRRQENCAGVAGGRGRHVLRQPGLESAQKDAGALVESQPKAFYFTDHYRDYPIVLIRLSKTKRAIVEPYLRRRWRELASKAAVREFDTSQEL